MPRHDNSSSYIAHGFVDDCDALMEKCAQFGRLNYEKFCDVWKEMQFVQIYQCRNSSAETAELSEEVLHIAKQYMINKNNDIEESVAGLFLVYALQNLQPYPRFAALRICPEDVSILESFIKVVSQQKRCDVLFILGSVLIKGPVQYHATERERGMELSYRKYVEAGTVNMKEFNSRRRGVFSRHSEAMDLIKECQTITRLYSETKSEITGTQNADRNLSYVNKDFASELEASFKKLITGNLQSEVKNTEDGNGQPEAVSSIKQRAMKNTVDPMKHLTGVQERKIIANKSPNKKNESKTKVSSPTKSTKKSRTKRKAPAKRKPKRKRIKKSIKYESDEDDDDHISLSSTDEDDKVDADTDSSQKEKEPVTEQEFEIEIDSLPVLFTTETEGNLYEIEVIDELKKDNITADVKETAKPVITENTNYTEIAKAPRALPEKMKRLERRELKQAILKSKFKRMGVLPVTNYKN